MGNSRRISNYQKRITLYDPTFMMSMVELVTISVESLKINSECPLKKDFTELIRINP